MPVKKGVDTVFMEQESYDPSSSHAPPFERIPQHSSDPRTVARLINDSIPDGEPYIFDFSSFSAARNGGGRYDELFSLGGSPGNIAAGSKRHLAVVSKCLDMIAGLWHIPQEEGNPGGGMPCFSGEQAAVSAGLAAWTRRRNENTGAPNIVVTADHNPVWRTFPRLFGVEMRVGANVVEVGALCDENTVMVVGTVGAMRTSLDDDIPELSQRLEKLHSDHGIRVPLHVDATVAGFVKPFTEPHARWDFRVPGVTSVSASVSYAGFTSVSLGWVLWRNAEDVLWADVGGIFAVNCDLSATSLPIGETVCHFYDMMRFGYDGHRAFQYERAATAYSMRDALAGIPQIDVLGKGSRAPFIVFRKDALLSKGGWTIEGLWKTLKHEGWGTALTELPAEYGGEKAIRLVVHHDADERVAELFVSDLRNIISRYEG